MSDALLLTLGLLAAVIACLARPCPPAQWSRVKASRLVLDPLPESTLEPAESAPASEPGFADGLTAAA